MDGILKYTERGIYCPAGDFYIDPWKPVDRALITHGHADHARSGMGRYLCSETAAPVIRLRLGNIRLQTIPFRVVHKIGDASVSFHPAGHVPGSAQIRVEVGGEVWVVSGDYKLEDDGVSEAFEPLPCHTFISECTFGLPVFQWPAQAIVAAEINAWWAESIAQGRTPILGAYSLGKAQRILSMLNPDIGPILTHPSVEKTNKALRRQGVHLPKTGEITPNTDLKQQTQDGALVLAPPSASGGDWARRFGAVSLGFASGWMRLRGIRRRRALDRGFVISDHADWPGLNRAIRETGASRIFVTHGYTAPFRNWLQDQGYEAGIVETEYEGEQPDTGGQHTPRGQP